MKRFNLVILSFVFALILIFSAATFFIDKNSITKANEHVVIPEGASTKEIASILEENGVIGNSSFFYYYIKLKSKYYSAIKKEKYPISFKQGTYSFEEGDFDSLISILNEGSKINSSERNVVLPEGRGVNDLITILADLNFGSEEEITHYLQSEELYSTLRSKYVWLPDYNPNKIYQLEGYLHANTYQIDNNSTLDSVIEAMLQETHNIYLEHIADLERLNISFDELLTLASVVEAESKFTIDRPKVAQVFYNRLNQGMKLESDITAAYANQEHKVFMYYDDIRTDSPYNTYVTPALPLGPINSPSLESITASLYPEGNHFNAIYFYARPSGETFYAVTFDEHETNRLNYEHEWKALENKTP